jgi:hypothetical protein
VKVPTELVGCQVARTSFDYQVRLYLNALTIYGEEGGYRVDAELVIDSPFLLRDPDGEWHELDPGTGSSVAPVLDLFQDTVAAVDINKHGALHLTFTSTAEVFVGPDPHYESWHLSGTGVASVTVGPGGETRWERPTEQPRPA